MRRALLLAAALLCLGAPAGASAGVFGVGVEPGWSARRLAERIAAATGHTPSTLLPGAALSADAASARTLGRIPGVAYVERLDAKRKLQFSTNDPYAARQWYLQADRAFDFWPTLPQLATVKVAVVDSGLDCGHPEFPMTRIAALKSFVGTPACTDTDGHGTFVAGEIAAAANNGVGIAGIAFPAQLLIAKVVTPTGDLPLQAEVEAIRWAADEGARVINLSLGGVRDPLDASIDSYSPLEQAAVDYAFRKGAVVVAAVGNGPQSPSEPWPYAHYPAALPHVLGVSAVTRSGAVPEFSNRDQVYNDIAAPGEDIFSTVPRAMTAKRPTCPEQGYSPCGTAEFRGAIGTSFAAPQVSAAAALVLSVRGNLRPGQVETILERTADDANAATGCRQCMPGRDRYTGWGTLDVERALQVATDGPLPPADHFETNDEAGSWAYPLWGEKGRTIHATVDFWDDQLDVYSIVLRADQRIYARLSGPPGARVRVSLWRPGTKSVEGLRVPLHQRVALSARRGRQERLAYTAPRLGRYYLAVKLQSQTHEPYPYTLAFTKASPPQHRRPVPTRRGA